MGASFVVVLTLNGLCAAGNTEGLICLMWAHGKNEIRTPKGVCTKPQDPRRMESFSTLSVHFILGPLGCLVVLEVKTFMRK